MYQVSLFRFLSRKFNVPSSYDQSAPLQKGKREMEEVDPFSSMSVDSPLGMVAERSGSNMIRRNCYFSPVQCLLPISDNVMRSFVINSQSLSK